MHQAAVFQLQIIGCPGEAQASKAFLPWPFLCWSNPWTYSLWRWCPYLHDGLLNEKDIFSIGRKVLSSSAWGTDHRLPMGRRWRWGMVLWLITFSVITVLDIFNTGCGIQILVVGLLRVFGKPFQKEGQHLCPALQWRGSPEEVNAGKTFLSSYL